MGSIELIDDHGWIVAALNDPEMLERVSEDGQEFKFDYSKVKQMADSGYILGLDSRRQDNRILLGASIYLLGIADTRTFQSKSGSMLNIQAAQC